ncbi:quinolinate phosphoribosyltransferase, decarboxylating [Citrifermentans bemidjiense Bem]|uniref:Probable nicotinate-nucleotide pyrophosphorylase [carboxylating] n=1 Tax=Citrifermentans bemidjiense (strain ATCC BAA-1014 / DSM 16622 / JCM 12645 / Bem) TaxID=404380 RepID=B5EF24_CITBB|nr:carboxylating nicotinate-nucleotide diphosphorylase [Citrifermentans bemidjiense]ACH39333.1 quinolinate phosphoribosyltransferase, decarboxylating [Citrifermentans bemidjiense Bem]
MNQIDKIIDNALAEDIHTGDITTLSVLRKPRQMRARLVAKEPMVLAGIAVAERVFSRIDASVSFKAEFSDGDSLAKGDVIARMEGNAASLLQGERVSLNLLQRMCGIATQTAAYVKELEGTGARVVDTRKTTPGLRVLEKYSVRVGGGTNHRTGLYDGVLIKENHIAAAGGILQAVSAARAYIAHTLKVEVETENLDQVAQAVEAGADIIMLDNMGLEEMTKAVQMIGKRALVEASGGVNLQTIKSIAQTGVDIISVGALTHSVRATDISMLMEEV